MYVIIRYRPINVNIENLVLTEHECMGPNWTYAEDFVLGVGAKMFTIAGPVIVYGLGASVVYGLIYWLYVIFC